MSVNTFFMFYVKFVIIVFKVMILGGDGWLFAPFVGIVYIVAIIIVIDYHAGYISFL